MAVAFQAFQASALARPPSSLIMAAPAAPPIGALHVPIRSADPNARIPLLGIGTSGTWLASRDKVAEAVRYAIVECGIRHVDTAAIYGNEAEVGQGIAAALDGTGISRADLFITSKLWNTDHGRVDAACRESLSRLGLAYLDLYLMHWPVAGNAGPEVQPPLLVTWRDMERLVDAGLARAIGVSNFSPRKLEALLASSARCKPVSALQAEAHPYFPNTALIEACAKHRVHFTAYSALGSRGSAGAPGGHAKGGRELLDSPLVAEVARSAHRSVAQCLLKWALQARPSCSALFKSVQRGHIAEDAALLGWRLCDANCEALSVAHVTECHRRYCTGDIFLNPQEGPYRTLRDLWDDDGTGEEAAATTMTPTLHAQQEEAPPTPMQARRSTVPQ